MVFGIIKGIDEDLKVGDKIGNSTSIGVAPSPRFAFYPSSKKSELNSL